MLDKNTFVIRAESLQNLVKDAHKQVRKRGHEIPYLQTDNKFFENTILVLENPNQDQERYPTWNQQAEDWYLNIFARSTHGPFEQSDLKLIMPYTYAWRARFFDHGWGYVKLLTEVLNHFNYSSVQITRQQDLDQLIRESYRVYHPDLMLAVLSWLGLARTQQFLTQPELTPNLINITRRDLIQEIVYRFQNSLPITHPSTSISLNIAPLDYSGFFERPFPHQGFTISYIFDKEGTPIGLETLRIHHELDIEMLQLEMAMDREWGVLIGTQLDLPLTRSAIFTRKLTSKPEITQRSDSTQTDDLMEKVLRQTTGYAAETMNVKAYLQLESYQRKAQKILAENNTV